MVEGLFVDMDGLLYKKLSKGGSPTVTRTSTKRPFDNQFNRGRRLRAAGSSGKEEKGSHLSRKKKRQGGHCGVKERRFNGGKRVQNSALVEGATKHRSIDGGADKARRIAANACSGEAWWWVGRKRTVGSQRNAGGGDSNTLRTGRLGTRRKLRNEVRSR